MAELVAEYWIYAVLAVIVGLLVAWWIVAANRKTTVALDRTDGATVRRNQALIDAPAAQAGASIPPPTPEGLAGVGEVIDASTTAAAAGRDDLKRIKGIGPKVERLLHGLGVTTFAEIAAWDDADVDRIDAQLGSFAGRIRRDDWRAQAALLAAEDTAAYESKFGKL
jgi:predicted flap endonuclease-1-like 5' DNA nuclease